MGKVTDDQTGRAQFDAFAASYDEEVNRSLAFTGLKVDYFTRVKNAYLLDLLRLQFGELGGLDLLDVGCGTGNCHVELAPQVGSLSGVDISHASIVRASDRNLGVSYRSYDGVILPYGDGQFDAVFTVCVMHHVPPGQWPHFAAELKRVLKPGGMAIVFEHNPLNPLTRRVVSNCEFDEDAVLLPQARVRNLLCAAGLKRVRSRAILSIPTNGPLTRRLDLALGRIGLGAQYFATGMA